MHKQIRGTIALEITHEGKMFLERIAAELPQGDAREITASMPLETLRLISDALISASLQPRRNSSEPVRLNAEARARAWDFGTRIETFLKAVDA